MCSFTIDCRCDTWSDGITRYQWPRIIAVQAPPSSSAELKKLMIVIAWTGGPPVADAIACVTSATMPATTPVTAIAGRIDASVRPIVAQ